MPSNNVSVGGKGVLTESDLEEQEKKIKEQEKEIERLKKQRIYYGVIGVIGSQILGLLIRKFLW